MKIDVKGESICAVGLIAGFFLPWINWGGFIVLKGYQIPDLLKGVGQMGAMMNQQTDIRITLIYVLLYLIPILSVITILMNLANQNPRIPAFLAGLIPFAGIIYLLLDSLEDVGADMFQVIGIGGYLTFFSAIGILSIASRNMRLAKQQAGGK